MKILILDDKHYTLHNIAELLEEDGYEVIMCASVFSANEQYKIHGDTIKCIIADLNLPCTGLTKDEIAETKGGMLTGWIWLKNYVFNDVDSNMSFIILSDYIDVLLELEKENNSRLLDRVTLIRKGQFDSFRQLSKIVEKNKVVSTTSKPTKKTVFLSYCSSDSDIMDIVENSLFDQLGDSIAVSRYTRDVNYKESFKEFMKSLIDHDFVITVISSNYLKSRACMYEIGELIKLPDFKDKILFVVLSDEDDVYYKKPPQNGVGANVYDPISRNEYILYWKSEFEKLTKSSSLLGIYTVNDDLNTALYETKKIIDNDLQQFLKYISDVKGVPLSEMLKVKLKPIIDIIQNR